MTSPVTVGLDPGPSSQEDGAHATSQSRAAGTARWRNAWVWVALLAALLLVAVIVGPGKPEGVALDPRSASGTGTKALVLLLQQFGATVDLTTSLPGPGVDVAVLLTDQLDSGRSDALRAWVVAGGTLLVADPLSQLQPDPISRVSNGFSAKRQVDGPCPRFGLDDVRRLDTGGSFYLKPASAAQSCFAAGRSAFFLTETSVDRGTIVALGGAGVFTNALIGHNDNSVLAVDLLAPVTGRRVAILLPSDAAGTIGRGRRSLWSLVAAPVKLALAQLFVAFVVVALWRGRRLGRPVSEAQLVDVPGSELVVAGGDLMARAESRDAAGAILRHGMRRWLGTRLGLGPAATVDEVMEAAVVRTALDGARLQSLLINRPLATDADLVALAQSIERARQEVTHDRQ